MMEIPVDWTVAESKTKIKNTKKNVKKKIQEDIPTEVVDTVVHEFLELVGNSDWNDPLNVSKTIADMMSFDLTKDPIGQILNSGNIDRTIFLTSNRENSKPFWICQSIIRVDEKTHRYIDYKGSKYNKIDIIFNDEHFKKRMDQVAKAAHCTWNIRWGNSRNEENRLYQKIRQESDTSESWLEKSIQHLLTENDVNGINIKNLIMIEFKRDLSIK